jgi:hypothetical protein
VKRSSSTNDVGWGLDGRDARAGRTESLTIPLSQVIAASLGSAGAAVSTVDLGACAVGFPRCCSSSRAVRAPRRMRRYSSDAASDGATEPTPDGGAPDDGAADAVTDGALPDSTSTPETGCRVPPPAPCQPPPGVTNLATRQRNPSSIAVDAKNAYWVNSDGTVMKVALCGGAPPVVLASAPPRGVVCRLRHRLHQALLDHRRAESRRRIHARQSSRLPSRSMRTTSIGPILVRAPW